ncbi:S1C family serine protease [Saliterribacillus persicus]|uniref:Serine protease Do n=1 Tax=Saliterribacillus persicus TaxID=930114 RepID=A0A368X993_9BACI|nr:trypsin-like peptidase domain-containing protein [Saliterribacillus persicus]RCW64522.1 serine protease Do [Saliterribacillus persicus]
MGYYDANYPKKRSNKKGKIFLPVLIGVLLGAFLFAFLLPTFVKYDLLPYEVIVGEKEGSQDRISSDSAIIEKSGENLQNIEVDISTTITDIVADVSPAVVGVVNLQSQSSLFEQTESGEQGTGSGVIYKVDGDRAFVVTNHHVIQSADEVEITFADESRVNAEIRGSDLFTDLAVLELDASYVDKVIELGSSENVNVGEPALAIGNPLGLHLSGSVTQGIISGKRRAIPQDFDLDGRADWQAEVIQTDAAINPGNSGGALINMNGLLIGINSMKIAQSSVEGIGFAIPIDDAIPIIEQLEQEGQVERPYLGVEAYSLNDIAQAEWERSLNLPAEVEAGIYIRSIEPRSPADSAGLEAYDVITALDGQAIQDIIDLRKHLYQNKEVGSNMDITFYRDGEKKSVSIELSSLEY